MYSVRYTKKFEKSVKLCVKRGLDLELLRSVITILAREGNLPVQYKPHKLSGKYSGLWECHIKNDWLLVWSQNEMELILLFVDTGTHSDLF